MATTALTIQIDEDMLRRIVREELHEILSGSAVSLQLTREAQALPPVALRTVTVRSHTDPSLTYFVSVENDDPISCTCPAFTYNPDKPCKHMVFLNIREGSA
jgi:hypothetical protein